MNSIFKKDGFTLIELLVVISIIGILSVWVLADYNSEIKRSRVRVAADTLYSEIQDLSVRVASGNQEAEVFQCWGIQIDDDVISRVVMDYVDGVCDFDSLSLDRVMSVGTGVDVAVEPGFEDESTDVYTDWYVLFEPPYADMNVLADNFSEVPLLENIEVRFSNSNVETEEGVRIDLLTGNYGLINE